MARYKAIDTSPRFLAVDLEKQLLRDCLPCAQRVAAFVSSLDEEVTQLFAQVLYLCDRQGLIGREMFAIDGVKLPSNASKANLRHNKRLDRFTLRGRKKVDTQWKLYCLVHNIEKLAHHGFGQ
jgi:hypothetical protein